MAAGAPKVVVLESDVVDTHIYTEEDLLEYAAHLGMDLEFDRDLLWIASAGLYASLPKPWITCQAEGSEDIFYFNPETHMSVWEHPSDEFYREMLAQTVQSRVTIAVCLRVEMSEERGVLTVIGTKLNGEEAMRVRILEDAPFADCRVALLESLSLPKATTARFFFEGTALGYSFDDKPTACAFGIDASDAAIANCRARHGSGRTVPRPTAEVAIVSGMPEFLDEVEVAKRLGTVSIDVLSL